ncbi:hypothetical protein Pyn_21301 [Prunus yedoensis var. nudiflora]|uniref:Uncharacterized protein n=1 Tax=Prunus yedoensis var. nudiflora TaxID=2094558 RepID=A0A314USJ5_PRUYE|nr:hypothetical protein Pyn_21301 [Prunus yedoensis var. nudiflora]
MVGLGQHCCGCLLQHVSRWGGLKQLREQLNRWRALSKDGWPEYYDGKAGRYIGKQVRKYQTWSISGYLFAKLMIENPANLSLISLEED